MPKGDKGELRPADVIGAAILIGRIVTGDAELRHYPAFWSLGFSALLNSPTPRPTTWSVSH